jgi:hypothetical protein
VPDWDNTESRESDEDAAWRDLVARLEEPAAPGGPAPWPERENVPRPRPEAGGEDRSGRAEGGGETQEVSAAEDAEGQRPGGNDGIRGFDDEGVRGAFEAEARPGADGWPDALEPDVIQAARRERRTAAHGTRARKIRARKAPPPPEDHDEHFIPPAPPPLPKLDPVTKGAWAALFGGPGYLVVATAVGWSVPGIAAFCAVAAFVTGFAILVLRMNEPSGPGPGGPDDGDDGAVV